MYCSNQLSYRPFYKHHLLGLKDNYYIKFYNNCTKKQIQCENENKLLAFKKFNKYIFVYSNNYNLEEIEGKYFYEKKK